MQDFPHRYAVTTLAHPEGDVALESEGLPRLATAPPAAFGGPGDRWSPETLLMGALALLSLPLYLLSMFITAAKYR